MIAIVDYGMGNLRSVRAALSHLGAAARITNSPAELRQAENIILPGVGAFGEAVQRIDALGIRQTLHEVIAGGKPVLGICLGMQLLFEASEESPGAEGLGVFAGTLHRFNHGVKVPHIGWNDAASTGPVQMFRGIERPCFYFVHSFYLKESPIAASVTAYGTEFVSAVASENVWGVQFHPEKSQSAGLRLLANFLRGER